MGRKRRSTRNGRAGSSRKKSKSRNWIQHAVKRPGELKRKLHGKLGRVVVAATKSPVWTRDGEINTNTLRKFTHTRAYQELDTTTKHQIQFALRAEMFRRDRR